MSIRPWHDSKSSRSSGIWMAILLVHVNHSFLRPAQNFVNLGVILPAGFFDRYERIPRREYFELDASDSSFLILTDILILISELFQ